jgi:tight adherence protein B
VILTALPGFGVLLGSGFGADPLGVLLGGPIGGVLCLIGAGFLAAGLLWTDRIVDGASR